jgi:hypothetical protein
MDGLPKFANVGNERPRLREATFEIGPTGRAQVTGRCYRSKKFLEVRTKQQGLLL